jgi:hypothetical protein
VACAHPPRPTVFSPGEGVVTEDEARRLEVCAVLGPVLQGYRDVLILARDLAERAAAGRQLAPADLALHHQIFETVEAQLTCLAALLQETSATAAAGSDR